MRILVVDDEIDLTEAIARGLRRQGYAVDIANDGDEAIEKSSFTTYDLVCLDLTMPGIDGLEVCQILRKNSPEGVIPRILMLTARDTIEERIAGLDVGADDYLNKPFDSEVLLFKIKAILQRKESDTSAENEQFEFNIGGFFFNSKLRHLSVGEDEPQKLSPKESKLLRMLALHKMI